MARRTRRKSRRITRGTRRKSRRTTRGTKRKYRKRNTRGGGIKKVYRWIRDTKNRRARREQYRLRERRALAHESERLNGLQGYSLTHRKRVQERPSVDQVLRISGQRPSVDQALFISGQELIRKQKGDLRRYEEQIRSEDDPAFWNLPGSPHDE